MGKKTLGIDISDGWITGVLLAQQAKAISLVSCCQLPLQDGEEVESIIRQLCQQADWSEGICALGLPLSLLSVRNLSFPFSDVKNIAQTLPFELEEQLIAPVDSLVTDFSLIDTTQSSSRIVAFALEKAFLERTLGALSGTVDPEIITPAVAPIARQVAALHKYAGQDLLLLQADLSSVTLVLIGEGQPLLYRRISYPEEMVLPTPFIFEQDRVVVANMDAARKGIHLLCAAIQRSVDFFRLESAIKCQPQRVVLTGPLAEVEALHPLIADALEMPVESADLLTATGIGMPEQGKAQWRGCRFDTALALALLGFEKKRGINFRKDSYAPKRSFLSSKKRLATALAAVAALAICFLGYSWNDYRNLSGRDRALREQMTAIYKQAFPAATKVRDPYMEMQAALKNVQGPASPAPLFVVDKRVLGLLADVSARIPPSVSLQVSRLAIDRESILIKGTTNTFNAVDAIKNNLSASSRYKEVKIVSATADKGKDKEGSLIRFEIELLLTGL